MTDLWRLNATDITARLKRREFSAVDVTEHTLERLRNVNPIINAVVQELPSEALAAAQAIDGAIAAGTPVGPLAGVPVTIKVNVDQQNCATTNGVVIQQDNIAEFDSPVVSNLRRAGAVIVGRTNTPAFSMRWFTRNSLHGHTLNPRNLALTPGGSSGGAAAAVAAGICAIGHGTDIAGSVRYPAYACGLHGLRPSLGRIPAVNLSLPDRHIGAQLTAVSGPIARSISDLRLAYSAMAVPSSLDPWSVPVPRDDQGFEKRVALCVAPDNLMVTDEVESALRHAAQQLEDAGYEVVECATPPMRQAMELQLLLWMSEFEYNGGAAIEKEADPDANFVYRQLLESCEKPTLHRLMETLQQRVSLAREWDLFLNQYPLLLCPVSAEPPFPDQLDVVSPECFKRVLDAQMTQIGLPFMGMPALSVATAGGDAPMGVQLVAPRYREDILFSAAAEIESRNSTIGIASPVLAKQPE